jgi:hypothetical protein
MKRVRFQMKRARKATLDIRDAVSLRNCLPADFASAHALRAAQSPTDAWCVERPSRTG